MQNGTRRDISPPEKGHDATERNSRHLPWLLFSFLHDRQNVYYKKSAETKPFYLFILNPVMTETPGTTENDEVPLPGLVWRCELTSPKGKKEEDLMQTVLTRTGAR